MAKYYCKPYMHIERFMVNEYIASCSYVFNCDAKPTGILPTIRDDSNNDNKYQFWLDARHPGDIVTCSGVHTIKKSSTSPAFQKAFLISLVSLSEGLVYVQNVYIWDTTQNAPAGIKKGIHVSTTEPQLNHS